MHRIHITLYGLVALLGLAMAGSLHAHPGSVDTQGCHRDSARAQRHCHPERKQARPAPRFSTARPPRAGDEGVFFGPLVRVTDGDSLRVKVQGVVMEFRLSQIDAPEKDQPYGNQARAELLSLVQGRQLLLVPIDTDRYGRTVAEVWVQDCHVNGELVKRGSAWFYDEFSQDAALHDLEQQARAAKRGLWALPASQRIEPWRWRREQR